MLDIHTIPRYQPFPNAPLHTHLHCFMLNILFARTLAVDFQTSTPPSNPFRIDLIIPSSFLTTDTTYGGAFLLPVLKRHIPDLGELAISLIIGPNVHYIDLFCSRFMVLPVSVLKVEVPFVGGENISFVGFEARCEGTQEILQELDDLGLDWLWDDACRVLRDRAREVFDRFGRIRGEVVVDGRESSYGLQA